MAENVTPFRDLKTDGTDPLDRIKADMDQLIGEFDFQEISRKVQDFGRQKPVAMAFLALTLGVAAGLLMRRGPSFETSPDRF